MPPPAPLFEEATGREGDGESAPVATQVRFSHHTSMVCTVYGTGRAKRSHEDDSEGRAGYSARLRSPYERRGCEMPASRSTLQFTLPHKLQYYSYYRNSELSRNFDLLN